MNISPEKFQWLVENVDPEPFYQDVMAASQDPNLGQPPQDPLGQALVPGQQMPQQAGMPQQMSQQMPQQAAPAAPAPMPQAGMMQGGMPPAVPRGMAPVPPQGQPLKRGF